MPRRRSTRALPLFGVLFFPVWSETPPGGYWVASDAYGEKGGRVSAVRQRPWRGLVLATGWGVRLCPTEGLGRGERKCERVGRIGGFGATTPGPAPAEPTRPPSPAYDPTMRLPVRVGLLSLLAGSSVALWALSTPPHDRPFDGGQGDPDALPRPTGNGEGEALGEHDEERAEAGREAWVEQMHRSHADWQALDRANGLAEVARHRALALAPPDSYGGAWVERGSNNQAGRMHVARLSTDGTQLYAGSAFGGLWRGTPEGTDWTPLGDSTYGGVHFLEVLAGAGAGDPDVLVTASDGGIVLRSPDAGLTWAAATDIGSPWWTRRLTQNDGTLLLVNESNAGDLLYRSVDRGESWQVVHDFEGYRGDVWAGVDGTLYLLDDGAVLSSVDDGDTWQAIGSLPASDYGDLTGSRAGAPTLYTVLDNAELWRSDDAGTTWSDVGALTDYWGGSLNASTVDSAMFVYGGVELHKSFDGGQTFEKQNDWGAYYGDPADMLHADIDGIDVIPDGLGGETWYVDCDGGIFHSVDELESVQNLGMTGLRVGQYYDVLTSSADPTHIAIGAQDQGYQLTTDVPQDDGLLEATQVTSGDYGHLTSSDGTHTWVFSVYPGFVLVQHGETDADYYYLNFPEGESYVPWLPPIVADPTERSAFFFPASHIFRYTHDGGANWTATRWSEQDFSVARDEYVSRMEFSYVDPTRVWAATSYGRVWWSDDGGVTWAMSPSMVADDNWYYGQAIAPSLTDKDTVTIGGSGYGVPAVYRSTDGGRTFFPWSDGLPDTLVYTLVEAPDKSGTIFAGTQTAAYRRGPDDEAWVDITSAVAPITTYWDAEALTAENTIRFATYGRGIWDYQIDPAGTGCYPPHDDDGDGVNCDLDCDDTNAEIHPGATEACDGRDVDCDPNTPAGGELDQDGDGTIGCEDCDDLNPARHPGATDFCWDGVDEDCDGADLACDDTPGGKSDGCGCASGAGGVYGAAIGLVGLALLGRRRRG